MSVAGSNRGAGARRRFARRGSVGGAPVAGLLLAFGAFAPAASAQGETGPAACPEAYPAVQRLRKAAKLRAARARALVCAQDVCSETVRTDCARWLEEIDRATPTLLVDARDEAGNELAEVRVEAGSELLAERLDGKPIVFDPGEYVFRFGHRGRTIERPVIVREAEKYRTLRVQFPAAGDAAPAPPTPNAASGAPNAASGAPLVPPAAGPSSRESKPIPLGSYVLGGVGAAGLLTFGALSLSAYLSERNLRDTCEPTDSCSQSDVDSVRTRYLVGDIALGVGVLAAGGAFALWAFRPASAPNGASASASVRLVPFGRGAALVGSF